MRSLLVLVGMSFVLACTDGTSAQPTKAEPTKAEPTKAETKVPPPKREWPADTPSATDCTTHEDCTVVPVAPGGDPCCDVTITFGPFAWKYLVFVEEYRKRSCEGVECPPLTLPGAQPAECAFVGRCLRGKCDLGCNDPEYMKNAGRAPPPM